MDLEVKDSAKADGGASGLGLSEGAARVLAKLAAAECALIEFEHAEQVAEGEPVTVELEFPTDKVKDSSGSALASVTIKPLEGRHLRKLRAAGEGDKVDFGALYNVAAERAGLTPAQWDLLRSTDAEYLVAVTEAFFVRGRLTGKPSSRP